MNASPPAGPDGAGRGRPRLMANRWQMRALSAGFVLFLAGLGGALYLSSRTERIRTEARHHTEVINTARDMLGAVLDCENGQRGYLLTHDQRYLEPYFVARVTVKAVSRNLAQLTRRDPMQAARAAALDPLVDDKIGEMERTVDLEQRGAHESALAIVESDTGRQSMVRLRAAVAEINGDEQRSLDRTRALLDDNAINLRLDILATLAAGFILLIIAARARTRLLRDLTRQNALLEDRVRERTQALEARTHRIETLMQDMSHRIGNSLSLVTGFLDLQARASQSEEVKGALAAARQRVFSIASAQRRMRLTMDSDTVETSFFDSLIEDFRNALPDHRVTIKSDIEPGALPSQDASAFGVILNELLANAFKHAWKPGENGELSVHFGHEDGARVLIVTDDGRGDPRLDTSGGLGQILVQSLVQSMRGALTSESAGLGGERPGLRTIVRAPS